MATEAHLAKQKRTAINQVIDFFHYFSQNNKNTGDAAGFFVFVALRPMSTAMVIAGRSVHLTTLFPGQA